jgi:hypothetical protein
MQAFVHKSMSDMQGILVDVPQIIELVGKLDDSSLYSMRLRRYSQLETNVAS